MNQDMPPDKELSTLFIVYTDIVDRFKKLQEKNPVETEEHAQDAIMLKDHCFQLYHMDDTLTCVHNEIVSVFY